MPAMLLTYLEYLGRMVLAALLGGIVGMERERRHKEAGVRTHLIVSLAACLMMLVSKYGFFDILGQTGIGLDPSRVAAGIVSGIGFLGAGIIFTRGGAVNGLTTAAGVWATVGIGMAAGAGMYFISISSALLVVFIQLLLHHHLPFISSQVLHTVHVGLIDKPDALEQLLTNMESLHVTLNQIRLRRTEDGLIADIGYYSKYNNDQHAFATLLDQPYIRTIEWM